jgi:chromosome segregation ATPase
MGIFSALGSLFGGPTGGMIGGIGDALLGRDDAREQNANTIQEAEKSRAWQQQMRQTAYQDTVSDLSKAGLSPMLAFSNGPTSASSAPQAGQLSNKGLSSAQTTAASAQAEYTTAQTENARAQTDLINAQTAKTEAEIAQVTTSTTNVAQQTENLKRQLGEIDARIGDLLESKNLKTQQGWTEANRRNLMDAQRELANIDKALRNAQITNTEAATATQRVITQLKKLEIPGLTNDAEFEIFTNTGKGSAVRHVGETANAAKKVIEAATPTFKIFRDKPSPAKRK